jgi:hypothetical protein
MAKPQLSQTEALQEILRKKTSGGKKRRYTLDQLVELVIKKTKRTVTRQSLIVRISELRSGGMKIDTFRGGASKDKDGAAQYQA